MKEITMTKTKKNDKKAVKTQEEKKNHSAVPESLLFKLPPMAPENIQVFQMRAVRSNPVNAHARVREVLDLVKDQIQISAPVFRTAVEILREELDRGVAEDKLTGWAVTLVVGTFDVQNTEMWTELRNQVV